MSKITKEYLERWCSGYSHCYYFLQDGVLYNTGFCPMACDEIAIDISNSLIFEDVTNDADKYHPQLEYEVEHNDCRLFRVMSRSNSEIIICYFGD